MHTQQRSPAMNRYVRGRVRSVAQLLGRPSAELEAEVETALLSGMDPHAVLDRLVLEALN